MTVATQPFYFIVPELSTNLVKNPSAERAGNFGGTATVTRDTTFAWKGFNSFKIVGTSLQYGSFTLEAATNAIHTVSLSVYGDITGWAVSINGTNVYTLADDFTLWDGSPTDPNGARYYRAFDASQCNASTTLYIIASGAGSHTLYVDALQVEQKTYPTTYIDPDIAGCYANGERHASSSFRSANERSGGRVRNFSEFGVTVDEVLRAGMYPITLNSQPLAQQPGAEYQGHRVLPRELTLTLGVEGSSLASLHALRNALIGQVSPNQVRDEQAIVLGYHGASSTRKVWGKFHYKSGLELGPLMGWLEKVPLSLTGFDPFWREWGNITQPLVFTQSIASTRLSKRSHAGKWSAVGGLNGDVYAVAHDYERGRTYVAGGFTTGNSGSTTLNYVGYYDGTQMVAMGTGLNDVAYALAIAPNGDVWVGSQATQAGGVATDKLAKWDVSAGAWVQYTFAGATVYYINALATDKNGLLYMGGNYLNIGGANGDYIVAFDGATPTALGSGTNAYVSNIIVAADGTVYATGQATAPGNGIGGTGCTFAKWVDGAWTGISGITAAVYQNTIFESSDGTIYVAGTQEIWAYNGNSLVEIYDFGVDIGGLAPYVGNSALVSLRSASDMFGGADYHLVWNGTAFTLPDFISLTNPNLPFFPMVVRPAHEPRNEPEVYAGHNGVTMSNGADNVLFTVASTAKTYPVLLITGPTTDGTACRLQWLQNITTGQKVFFSHTINAGEYAVIDFRPFVRGVYTPWAGRPGGAPLFQRTPDLDGGGLNYAAGRRVGNQPLAGSDFAAFHLQAGSNIVGLFISGTTTGVTATLAYTPVHAGVDGGAA